MNNLSKTSFGTLSCVLLSFIIIFSSCGGSSSDQWETKEVKIPSQGLITVLQEVQKDQFKIEDEKTIPDTSASLVIAKYMDTTIDTFTLDQIRLMRTESGGGSYRSNGIMTAASLGLFGYFMGRSMARRPSAGAYTNQSAYNRSQSTGNAMNQSAATRTTKTRRPTGTSGHGSTKKSTRSYGG